MLESEVENYAVEQLEDRGVWPLKYTSSIEYGLPDRLCLFPSGKVVWIEFKRPGRHTLDPIQKEQIKKLMALKQTVYLINSKGKVRGFIQLAEKEGWFNGKTICTI